MHGCYFEPRSHLLNCGRRWRCHSRTDVIDGTLQSVPGRGTFCLLAAPPFLAIYMYTFSIATILAVLSLSLSVLVCSSSRVSEQPLWSAPPLLLHSSMSNRCYMTPNGCFVHSLRLAGDVEEGAVTNNSHAAEAYSGGSTRNNKADRPEAKEEAGGDGGGGGASREDKEEKASHSKEKSVLQAKLTKLAIQIGYAGKHFVWLQCPFRLRYSESCLCFRFHRRCTDSHHSDYQLLCCQIHL